MNFTVKAKMGVMGAGTALALLILAGTMFWSNSVVGENAHMVLLRQKQLDLAKSMKLAQTELLLAAMDSIIDREEGSINPERMELIEKSSDFLVKNSEALKEAADTQQEKDDAADVAASIQHFTKAIRVDLKELVEGSAARVGEIQRDFERMDDELDEAGTAIEKSLLALEREWLSQGKHDAVNLSMEMQLSQTKLVLAAMDSIIDRSEGRINDERWQIIVDESASLTEMLPALQVYAVGPQERELARKHCCPAKQNKTIDCNYC